jgi:uncharacterized membrane protein
VSAFLDAIAPLGSTIGHYLPTLVLLWLAVFFGSTLRQGAMPLIERIARQGMPALSIALSRYARGLTAAWCCYFVAAAVLTRLVDLGAEGAGVGVAVASAVFFVGEYWLRRLIFPGEVFPSLIQQVRDTVRVWRPRAPP